MIIVTESSYAEKYCVDNCLSYYYMEYIEFLEWLDQLGEDHP